MKERKESHRLDARARRRAIPARERERKSARIRESVLALPEVRDARLVACYVSVHSEVGTHELLQELLDAHKRIAVPVVEPPERMALAEVFVMDELELGAHGIPEPRPPHERVRQDEVDVVLVPGLAFSVDGHRLGNGGGYFDRMLARMPRARRIGLAFEEQVAASVPHEPHDATLDGLVTDARVMRFSRSTSS